MRMIDVPTGQRHINPMTQEDALVKPKAKTARGKRFLESREPQVHEGVKRAIFMKAPKSSVIAGEALADLVLEVFLFSLFLIILMVSAC